MPNLKEKTTEKEGSTVLSEQLLACQRALEARGFAVRLCGTGEEARDFVLSQVPAGAVIGVGGSVTIRQIGLADALRDRGHTVHWHWYVPGPETLHAANNADVYLSSANAVTMDGLLVNIDMTGNRVAALTYGPAQVYVICGRNKLVQGGVPQAIARIKREACPSNARRLGLSTPCAALDRCDAAHCENPMCRVTGVLEHPTRGHAVTVLLVDEDLGY